MNITRRILYNLFLAFLSLPSIIMAMESNDNNETHTPTNGKKILIYYGKGGNGHVSVKEALSEYLTTLGHDVTAINIFDETLQSIDPIPGTSGTNLYNSLRQKKLSGFINTVHSIGSRYYQSQTNTSQRLINEDIKDHNPDTIISVIPIVNGAILKAAQKQKKQFILIPTDLDPSIALQNINDPQYNKFTLALPFEHEKAAEVIAQHQIPSSSVAFTGFPLRKNFLHLPETKLLSEADGKNALLLMIGKTGAADAVREIYNYPHPLHLFIVGAPEQEINNLASNNNDNKVSRTLYSSSDQIAELMTIVNLVFLESGSVRVNEALRREKPMLLDHRTSVPKWEEYNHAFIKEKGVGDSINSNKEIVFKTQTLLHNSQEIKDNYKQIKQVNPQTEIPKLIGLNSLD